MKIAWWWFVNWVDEILASITEAEDLFEEAFGLGFESPDFLDDFVEIAERLVDGEVFAADEVVRNRPDERDDFVVGGVVHVGRASGVEAYRKSLSVWGLIRKAQSRKMRVTMIYFVRCFG
jgi:hypothetical protein